MSYGPGITGRTTAYRVDPFAIDVREGWNPRIDFGNLEELADSIAHTGGPIKPIQVMRGESGTLELVDGERRLRATRMAIKKGAKITSIMAILTKKGTDPFQQMAEAVMSNNGKPLLPMEEAKALTFMLADIMKTDRDLTKSGAVEQIAKAVGKSSTHVGNRLLLVAASPEVVQALEKGIINLSIATEIVRKTDTKSDAGSDGHHNAQNEVLDKAKKDGKKGVKKVKKDLDMTDSKTGRKRLSKAMTELLVEQDGLKTVIDSNEDLNTEEATLETPEAQYAYQEGVMAGICMALDIPVEDIAEYLPKKEA